MKKVMCEFFRRVRANMASNLRSEDFESDFVCEGLSDRIVFVFDVMFLGDDEFDDDDCEEYYWG